MRVTPLGKAETQIRRSDQSILCYLKCVGIQDLNGVDITASTVTPGANALTITTNAAVDTDVDAGGLVTYATELSVQAVLDRLNGISADVVNTRYRAALGDYRPGYVLGAGDGLAAAAQNILLGRDSDGYAVLADISNHGVANTMSVCLGGPRAREGTEAWLPDHFESDYTSTTAGVITNVRAMRRRREEQNSPRIQTIIESIHCGAAFAGADLTITVYDNLDNLIWQYVLGAGTDVPRNVLEAEHPIVGPMGSPLFVEAAGTGAFTDGPLAVRGRRAVA
jgi:hypothetical protein